MHVGIVQMFPLEGKDSSLQGSVRLEKVIQMEKQRVRSGALRSCSAGRPMACFILRAYGRSPLKKNIRHPDWEIGPYTRSTRD